MRQFMVLAAIHFIAVVSPGPDFAITVQQSLRWGRKIGVATALGIGCGISLHVAYTLLGVGALMHMHSWVTKAIGTAGAIYLLYLAIQLLGSRGSAAPLPPAVERTSDDFDTSQLTWSGAFSKGFLTNALNPKATLFFLAIFTTLVSPSTPLTIQIMYGVWMCAVNAAWFMAVANLFTVTRIRNSFLRFSSVIDKGMGVAFAVFAIRLLFGAWA